MYKLFSWYNRNRKKVWSTILAIFVIGLIIWRIIFAIAQNTNVSNEGNEQDNTSRIDTNSFNSIAMNSQKSALSGNDITVSEEKIKTIDNFISFCNSGNPKDAYGLISDECKRLMFPDGKTFMKYYYTPIFGDGKRTVSIENWTKDIYLVNFNENFLATGKYSKDNVLQDYITIVKDEQGNNKLNINKYIANVQLNKSTTLKDVNISINVIEKNVYVDYEVYTIEIANKSEQTIALGDVQNLDLSYLTDKNELKYNAYNNEITQEDLVTEPNQTKKIKIKYFNKYTSTREIKRLTFSKVLMDYETYKVLTHKEIFTDTITVRIEL